MTLGRIFKSFANVCDAYFFLYLLSVADNDGKVRKTPEEIVSESKYPSDRINAFIARNTQKVHWDGKHLRIQNRKEYGIIDTDLAEKEDRNDTTSYEGFVRFFNETLDLNNSRIPRIRLLKNPARRRKLKNLIRDYGNDMVREAIVEVATSHFLNYEWLIGSGRTGCDFDWIMNPTNFEKIINGKYSNTPGNSRPS